MIGIQEGIPTLGDVAEDRGNPHEIEGLANTAANAVQHGALAQRFQSHPPGPAAAAPQGGKNETPALCARVLAGIPRQPPTAAIACTAFSTAEPRARPPQAPDRIRQPHA